MSTSFDRDRFSSQNRNLPAQKNNGVDIKLSNEKNDDGEHDQ